MLNAIILATITLIVTAWYEINQLKESNDKGFDFLGALIGITIALFFLSFPLFVEYKGINRLLCPALFAIQSLMLNEDIELINSLQTPGLLYIIFSAFTYTLYFVAPLLSVTALLSLFQNTFYKVKMKLSFKKEYHFFSEINEKTSSLANNISDTNKNAKIIFTDKSNRHKVEKRLKRKYLKIEEKINDLNFSKINKKKIFYFMSEDEQDNLKESLILLNKVKLEDNIKVYILNDTQEAYMMIDSLMAEKNLKENEIGENNLEVETVNERERVVLQRLESLPIEKIFNTEDVNVLIVGCGRFGQVFLKSITWCFQVIGHNLKIIVIEKNAKEIKDKINMEAPELLKKYQIHFIDKSIEEVIYNDLLSNININYTVINTGDDSNNFNIAVALRRYFLRKGQDDVIIDVSIRDKYKSKNILTLKDEANKSYNLNPFGSIEDAYYYHSIINSQIEKMAKMQNEFNSSTKNKKSNSYLSEYNRKSSRASVVHLKYKLYSLLKEEYTEDIAKDLEKYKEYIKDERNISLLAENEQNRWSAYMYADGYKTATIKDVENYYEKIGNKHKNTLARLHPALVSNEKLPQTANELNKLIGKLTGVVGNHDFVKQNEDIIKKLDDLVNLNDTKED